MRCIIEVRSASQKLMTDESNACCSHLEVSHETTAGGGGHVSRKEGGLSNRLKVGQVAIANLRGVR